MGDGRGGAQRTRLQVLVPAGLAGLLAVRSARRRPRRFVVLTALAGAVATYRKQRLDAADAAFPEASVPAR